ncbi:FLUCTUATING-LIGHT-ACCLIMATION protein 1, chloroplastic [Typha latifolia]|uniref:FLUCTUATING-LIGHT-ACCLIMATION protein 1, chloroplastic n=1 Tax=Typha latifolia TaxID=4733 RepID=UPI003C2CF8D4
MATASLLKSVSLLRYPSQSRPPPLRFNPLLPKFPLRFPSPPIQTNRAIRICAAQSNRNRNPSPSPSSPSLEGRTSPFDHLISSVLEALKPWKKPAIALLLIGALVMVDPFSALAASGGRMGGSAFSSSSSRSRSSHSSSYSPSYSRSYSAPLTGSFYSAPFYSAPPILSVSGTISTMIGIAGFFLLFAAVSDWSAGGSVLTETQKTSVVKLQVGLLGMARSFQRDLDKIAESADTSTPQGLNYVLTETALALLRHPDCCISAYSSVDTKRSIEDGEKRFNQLSIEERGKFDEETLVNMNSIKRHKTTNQRSSGFSNEYIVITILVAAEGVHKLPTINSSSDLKVALQKLGSIPSSKTLAVEVLWTPQNENDTLSERELLEDYSLLRPL